MKTKATTNKPDLVVDQIKQEIIFGRLRPRERLVEDELCMTFGASRHQIRAAFVELEDNWTGYTPAEQGGSTPVRDCSAEEIEQSFEVCALLQAEAANRIPLPLRAETLRTLEGMYKTYCEAINRVDLEQVVSNTVQFHRVLFDASNNKCLAEIIAQIWARTLAVRCYAIAIPELLERARQEHAKILDALRSGNRRELLRLCVDHSKPALDAYKRLHGGWAAKNRSSPAVFENEPAKLKRRKAK